MRASRRCNCLIESIRRRRVTFPRTQCYRCQGYGHLTSQCLSQTKTLLVEVLIEDVKEEDGLEVTMHQQDDDLNVSAEKCGFNATLEL